MSHVAVLYQNSYKSDESATTKEPCVLLHGLFGMSSNLLSVAKGLSEIFTPLIFDLPNHGHSPTMSPCTFIAMAEMLHATLQERYDEDTKIHVLGHSLGGKLAMVYALLYPERVSSLVMMDIAPVTYPPFHLDVIKGFQELEQKKPSTRNEVVRILEPYAGPAETAKDMATFLAKNILFENNAYAGSQIRVKELTDSYDELRSFPTEELSGYTYKGPTLILRAEHTEYFEDAYMKVIDTFLPSWELETVFDSGHNIHIDQPVETKELLIDFYRQLL